ncbi:MAG: DUF962 domain-containing protein [Opitutales bacterium]|nr:DUF962 domain-containing protein [Opitutales bacterium]
MPGKSADRWFAACDAAHPHAANRWLRWSCVPVIFFALLGLAWAIPVSAAWEARLPWFNWSLVAIALACGGYACLSLPLAVGLLAGMAAGHAVLLQLEFYAPWPVGQICLVLLVAAGIGWCVGHRIEGRKWSWRADGICLLLAPAWLLSRVYRRVGLPS